MCGIIGAISGRSVGECLVHCLQRLEYRGYDSAGVVTVSDQGLARVRVAGKVQQLCRVVEAQPIVGACGLAHTRWATHGKPTEANAHPHVSRDRVAVVHNGIIENFDQIRANLLEDGYVFVSETDTEVIAHAFHRALGEALDVMEALRQCCDLFEGSYAFGLILTDYPQQLWAVCHGSPLVIGLGEGEHFIASDMVALASLTSRYIYMEEGDIALLEKDALQIYDRERRKITRQVHTLNLSADTASKGDYRHFMLKEIFEQPKVVRDTLEGRLDPDDIMSKLFSAEDLVQLVPTESIQIVACGTSYHAGLVAKYWFEGMCGIPCQVEVASEYRYRTHVVQPNTLFITISQSGETADTLAALRLARGMGYLSTLVVCNVANSALARLSDYVLLTRAGVEIGVASTKAFMTQLVVLHLLVLGFCQQRRQAIDHDILSGLKNLAGDIERLLALYTSMEQVAQDLSHYHHALFLGRNSCYPVALEGALKLKEISYIHAEAYPAGELKHGPLALVDEDMPIIVLAPNNGLIDKLQANVQEVSARGGRLLVLTDDPVRFSHFAQTEVIVMPTVAESLVPLLYTIPLQLLAYDVARVRGTDIDQPRNLAKSVTVE